MSIHKNKDIFVGYFVFMLFFQSNFTSFMIQFRKLLTTFMCRTPNLCRKANDYTELETEYAWVFSGP